MNKAKALIMAKSYGRAFLVAVVMAITMGKTNPKDIFWAAVVSTLAPLVKAIDPKDTQFGMGA